MTDLQALQSYATRRDAEAFRLLVQSYQRLVYAAVRRRLAHAQDIEDAVQLTFLKLAQAAGTIRREGTNLAAWLYATALHTATDLVRQDAARRRREAAVQPAIPGNPIDQHEWHKLSLQIDDAILALPPEEQSLIIEHFFHNRSTRDLATDLRTSQSTVTRRLATSVENLRKILSTNGHLAAAPLLTTAMQNLAAIDVPIHLTANLTKIGLASTPAPGTALAGIGTAKLLAGAAIAAAVITTATVTTYVMNTPSPAPAAAVVPAPRAHTLPAAPADLVPTDLEFTRVNINIDNRSGEMAAQIFSEQTQFRAQLTPEFPATPSFTPQLPAPPPFSLQLKNAAYLDALFQFADRLNGTVEANGDAPMLLISPGALPANTWNANGPFAAVVMRPSVSFTSMIPPQAFDIHFYIEPQNRQHILFPDTVFIETFLDDQQQPILLAPNRTPSLGSPWSARARSLTLALARTPNPIERVSIFKGKAPFRLVTKTETLTANAPDLPATLPIGDAAVEILPFGIEPGGPLNTYRNFTCQVRFLRRNLDENAWKLFTTHFIQAKVAFTDSNGELIQAFRGASNYPNDQQSVNITFTTSANERQTTARSIRIEIPTESRPILFPFEFKDFPFPGGRGE